MPPQVIIIGAHAEILPFKAVGVTLRPVETVDDARAELRKIAVSVDEGLVLIPEELAAPCRGEMTEIRRHPGLAALALPSTHSRPGQQREYIRDMVRRAIGVDLMAPKKRDP